MDKFICPNCKTEWNRDTHYLAILQNQNFIQRLIGDKQIVDMCGRCNYFEYQIGG